MAPIEAAEHIVFGFSTGLEPQQAGRSSNSSRSTVANTLGKGVVEAVGGAAHAA
jgi:hypothetical protein